MDVRVATAAHIAVMKHGRPGERYPVTGHNVTLAELSRAACMPPPAAVRRLFPLLPPMQRHPHAKLRPEGNQRLGRDGVAENQAGLPALGEGGQHEDALGPGETLADAQARSGAEGEIGKLGASRLRLWGPTVGVEALGVKPIARVAVHDVLAEEDRRAGRQDIAAHLVILYGLAADSVDRWAQRIASLNTMRV